MIEKKRNAMSIRLILPVMPYQRNLKVEVKTVSSAIL
jgi:hypothetical protein